MVCRNYDVKITNVLGYGFQVCHKEFFIKKFFQDVQNRLLALLPDITTSVILTLWPSYLMQHFFEPSIRQSPTFQNVLITLWSSKISRREASFEIKIMTIYFLILPLWSRKTMYFLWCGLLTSYQIFVVSTFFKKKLNIVEARSMSFQQKYAKKTQIT